MTREESLHEMIESSICAVPFNLYEHRYHDGAFEYRTNRFAMVRGRIPWHIEKHPFLERDDWFVITDSSTWGGPIHIVEEEV